MNEYKSLEEELQNDYQKQKKWRSKKAKIQLTIGIFAIIGVAIVILFFIALFIIGLILKNGNM